MFGNNHFSYFKHNLNEITQSNSYEIFMTMLTFLVLYADDLRGISLSKVKNKKKNF